MARSFFPLGEREDLFSRANINCYADFTFPLAAGAYSWARIWIEFILNSKQYAMMECIITYTM
jgi:hypothetical protein